MMVLQPLQRVDMITCKGEKQGSLLASMSQATHLKDTQIGAKLAPIEAAELHSIQLVWCYIFRSLWCFIPFFFPPLTHLNLTLFHAEHITFDLLPSLSQCLPTRTNVHQMDPVFHMVFTSPTSHTCCKGRSPQESWCVARHPTGLKPTLTSVQCGLTTRHQQQPLSHKSTLTRQMRHLPRPAVAPAPNKLVVCFFMS